MRVGKLAHVYAEQRVVPAGKRFGQAYRERGLAHARRSGQQEGAVRPAFLEAQPHFCDPYGLG